MQKWQYIIQKEDQGKSLESLLRQRYLCSRKWIRACKAKDRVRLNGQVAYLCRSAKAGDLVEMVFDEKEVSSIQAVAMDLDVLLENQDYLVVNKPPYMPTHPVGVHQKDTLANGVIHYFHKKGLYRTFRPAGRLDANTSGILMVCKHPLAQAAYVKMGQAGQVKKQYLALCQGQVQEKSGHLSWPIGPSDNPYVRKVDPQGKEAHTLYKLVRRYKGHCLLLITLLTGRTHQIRVHLAQLGHPLVGDALYGAKESPLASRHLLHASRLTFTDPQNPQETIRIRAPLADDFLLALRSLSPSSK